MSQPSLLIATLGAEPQVVTIALQLLTRQGETISEAHVLHTASAEPALTQSIQTLAAAFQEPALSNTRLHFRPICNEQGQPLKDVDSPRETQAAFRFTYQILREAKQEGWRVHLLIAGGRKTLTLFSMVAAQILFDEGDHLWHLHSERELLTSRRLFLQPGDQAYLVPIPVIRWSQVSPIITDLEKIDDPLEAVRWIESLQLHEKLEKARSFILGALTPSEARCVALLVQESLSDQEIAERLFLSRRTIEQHLRSAYTKAANHWELADVNRSGLVHLLSLYYTLGTR